jgi:hypothetical protein
MDTSMFRTIVRVLFGFVIACLAAGLTKVLFAVGPQDLLSGNPDSISNILNLTAQFATVFAIFSALFALLAAVISEWQALRGFFFHAAVGLAIATAGFGAQYFGEAPNSPTIFNNYGIGAFAATGLVGGIVYWLFAGRHAGYVDDIYDTVPTTAGKKSVAASLAAEVKPKTPAPPAPSPSPVQKPTPQGTVPTVGAKKD